MNESLILPTTSQPSFYGTALSDYVVPLSGSEHREEEPDLKLTANVVAPPFKKLLISPRMNIFSPVRLLQQLGEELRGAIKEPSSSLVA